MNMLEKCIPWTQKLVFCSTDTRYITPSIERIMQTKKNRKYTISTYDQLEIDRKTLAKTMTNLPPTPEGMCILDIKFQRNILLGYEIRPLALEDAPLLIDAWGDTSFDLYSVNQVRFFIKRLPTLGDFTTFKLDVRRESCNSFSLICR